MVAAVFTEVIVVSTRVALMVISFCCIDWITTEVNSTTQYPIVVKEAVETPLLAVTVVLFVKLTEAIPVKSSIAELCPW